PEMSHDDYVHALANITHRSNLILQRDPSSSLRFCPNTSLNLLTAVGRHRVRGGRCALRSGIPAPPARVRFGYHTSKRLTSAPARRPCCSARGSNHGHSAIHMQRLAGHVASLIRGEKDDRGRDLAGRSCPARRNFGDDGFPLLIVELVRHWRDNKARRDAIRGDA